MSDELSRGGGYGGPETPRNSPGVRGGPEAPPSAGGCQRGADSPPANRAREAGRPLSSAAGGVWGDEDPLRSEGEREPPGRGYPSPVPPSGPGGPPPPRGGRERRLPRVERRDQILAAATRAFARGGFAGTGLDDVAAEAGVSRVILYRHFDSKTDLYRAVLDRACARLAEAVGAPDDFHADSVDALLAAAAEDPDAFRLLFVHAAREPEFRAYVDQLSDASVDIAHRYLVQVIPDPTWAEWAARLTPAATIAAVIAWLDAGQPDREHAARRILHVLGAITEAAT